MIGKESKRHLPIISSPTWDRVASGDGGSLLPHSEPTPSSTPSRLAFALSHTRPPLRAQLAGPNPVPRPPLFHRTGHVAVTPCTHRTCSRCTSSRRARFPGKGGAGARSEPRRNATRGPSQTGGSTREWSPRPSSIPRSAACPSAARSGWSTRRVCSILASSSLWVAAKVCVRVGRCLTISMSHTLTVSVYMAVFPSLSHHLSHTTSLSLSRSLHLSVSVSRCAAFAPTHRLSISLCVSSSLCLCVYLSVSVLSLCLSVSVLSLFLTFAQDRGRAAPEACRLALSFAATADVGSLRPDLPSDLTKHRHGGAASADEFGRAALGGVGRVGFVLRRARWRG